MRLRTTVALAAVLLALLFGWLAFDPEESRGRFLKGIPGDDTDPARRPTSTRPPSSAPPFLRGPQMPVPTLARTRPPAQPLPKPGSRLVDIHDTLARRALNGDVRAACRLAFELETCARLPGVQNMVAQIRQRDAEETDPAMREGHARALAFFGAIADRGAHTCDGVASEETTNAWKWQVAAALAGYPPSMARFAAASVFGSQATHDGVHAYRDHAADLLQRAIDAGEPIAFELAMHAHRRGESFGSFQLPKDPVRAAAYALALHRAASPAYARYFDLEDLQRSLGAERFAQARHLSQSLAAKLAHLPPGAVDFTNGTQGRDDGSHCEAPPPQ